MALVLLVFLVRLILRERRRRALGLPDPDQEYLEEIEEEDAADENGARSSETAGDTAARSEDR